VLSGRRVECDLWLVNRIVPALPRLSPERLNSMAAPFATCKGFAEEVSLDCLDVFAMFTPTYDCLSFDRSPKKSMADVPHVRFASSPLFILAVAMSVV
jgi:hypothetical protein